MRFSTCAASTVVSDQRSSLVTSSDPFGNSIWERAGTRREFLISAAKKKVMIGMAKARENARGVISCVI